MSVMNPPVVLSPLEASTDKIQFKPSIRFTSQVGGLRNETGFARLVTRCGVRALRTPSSQTAYKINLGHGRLSTMPDHVDRFAVQVSGCRAL